MANATVDPGKAFVLNQVMGRFQVASTRPNADKNQAALQNFCQANLADLKALVESDQVSKDPATAKFIQDCLAKLG